MSDHASSPPALSDTKTLRTRARHGLVDGAVTPSYPLDLDAIVGMLNVALATEMVCVLRYRRHYHTAAGIHSEAIKAEFLAHAADELSHADLLAARIVQLGGRPDFSPNTLQGRSHAEYTESLELRDMIADNLLAERIAIESYREMITYVGGGDPTTRRILESILGQEEEHADDMGTLLATLG